MKSLAVTLACFLPRTTTLTDSGTFTRTSLVIQELKTSVVPMPKATAADGARVRRVRVRADDQLPGQRIALQHDGVADAFRAFAVLQLAVQLDAALAGKVFLLELELAGEIEQPHLALLFGEITSSRNVRWSRKKRIDAGSFTGTSLPTKCSKKIAAMGVTYSWLKRRSVRAKPESPGLTAATPTCPSPIHHVPGKDLFRERHRTRLPL